jgi:hypothetical protein
VRVKETRQEGGRHWKSRTENRNERKTNKKRETNGQNRSIENKMECGMTGNEKEGKVKTKNLKWD